MKKKIILVAGVPRSGSTWLFNAVRRLLETSGMEPHAAWFSDWNRSNSSPTHLVKVHSPEDVDFQPDLVLTTFRPTQDCLASLVRMGWLKSDAEAIRNRWVSHKRLHEYWKQRSSLETSYQEIICLPKIALTRIATLLGIPLDCSEYERIAEELKGMKAPVEGAKYNPTTLMHPGHRNLRPEVGLTPEDILRIAAE